MKKIILLLAISFIAIAGYSQAFTVTVELSGDCVYPQSETVYVAHVMIHKNFQLVAQNTVITNNTNLGSHIIPVQLPQFCSGDDSGYQILIEGGKVDVNTKEELCRGKRTVPNTYTCAQFYNGFNNNFPLEVE